MSTPDRVFLGTCGTNPQKTHTNDPGVSTSPAVFRSTSHHFPLNPNFSYFRPVFGGGPGQGSLPLRHPFGSGRGLVRKTGPEGSDPSPGHPSDPHHVTRPDSAVLIRTRAGPSGRRTPRKWCEIELFHYRKSSPVIYRESSRQDSSGSVRKLKAKYVYESTSLFRCPSPCRSGPSLHSGFLLRHPRGA